MRRLDGLLEVVQFSVIEVSVSGAVMSVDANIRSFSLVLYLKLFMSLTRQA